ncbi:MAG: hypothetical protein WCT54_01000 [Patescibacteria group bacterium]
MSLFPQDDREIMNRSNFLGTEDDPRPTFRDEAENVDSWPSGAVFKVDFTAENSPSASVTECEIPRTEFFGADGWPIGFPDDQKSSFERVWFQVFPWSWHRWTEDERVHLSRFNGQFARLLKLGAITRTLAGFTSKLCNH